MTPKHCFSSVCSWDGNRDSACFQCFRSVSELLAGVNLAGAQRQGGAHQQQEAAEAEQDQLAALVREAAAASKSPAVLALVPPELRSKHCSRQGSEGATQAHRKMAGYSMWLQTSHILRAPHRSSLHPPAFQRVDIAACRALTEYLRRPDVLQTPGLFVNRADHMSLEVAEESKIVRYVLCC